MKDIEMQLKELIIKEYGSLKAFSDKINMPWTTLDSILKRGINKANIANVLKITSELNIDAEQLALGALVKKIKNSVPEPSKNQVDYVFCDGKNEFLIECNYAADDCAERFGRLLAYYLKLNDIGQDKALEYIFDLLESDKYTNNGEE